MRGFAPASLPPSIAAYPSSDRRSAPGGATAARTPRNRAAPAPRWPPQRRIRRSRRSRYRRLRGQSRCAASLSTAALAMLKLASARFPAYFCSPNRLRANAEAMTGTQPYEKPTSSAPATSVPGTRIPGANEPARAVAPASAARDAAAMTATRPFRSYSMPMTMRAAPFVVETNPTEQRREARLQPHGQGGRLRVADDHEPRADGARRP